MPLAQSVENLFQIKLPGITDFVHTKIVVKGFDSPGIEKTIIGLF